MKKNISNIFDGKKYKICMSKVIRTILYFGVGLYLIVTGFLLPFSLTSYTMWMPITNILLGVSLPYSLKNNKSCTIENIKMFMVLGIGIYLIATGTLLPFILINHTMWWMFIVNIILGIILSYSLGITTKD